VAELLKDPVARIEMLLIAEGYGHLAQRARNNSDAAENSIKALPKKLISAVRAPCGVETEGR